MSVLKKYFDFKKTEIGLLTFQLAAFLAILTPVIATGVVGASFIDRQVASGAFTESDQQRRFLFYAFGLAVLLGLLFAYSIARYLRVIYEYRQREEAFLESIGEGIIATDNRGSILFLNTAAEMMLGWKKGELLGKSWATDIPQAVDDKGKPIPPEQRATIIALQARRPVTRVYWYVRRDGTRFPVSVTAAPILLEERAIGSTAVFRDIAEELALDRAKSEFVSLASHQLRTPMTSMKWFIELLASEDMGKLNAEQKSTLKDLKIINKNMIDLVSGLLNVARIELNTYAIEPQPVSLAEEADSVLSEHLPIIGEKKLKIVKRYASSLSPLNADASLIHVLLQNLINNAVKYTPEGGTVTITIGQRSDDLTIDVADTGYGIPKGQQSLIFSKMFRADNVKQKVSEGTGLGLYAAKAIVEQAGGKIWFESSEGQGTTFHVTLPLSGMERKEGTSRLS